MPIISGSSSGTSFGNTRNRRTIAPGGMFGTQPNIFGAQPSSPLENQYKLYNTGVEQQAEDYSGIMQGYKDLLAKSQNVQPLTAQTYTPNIAAYQPSVARTGAISNLGELSKTGGYSPEDIANIRARGISPIRSVYSGAMRDVNRQRALQGGYSPNYNAVRSKMAREMSDLVSGKVTDINADIAQRVAGNRLTAAPSYASAADAESEFANQIAQRNAETENEAQRFNIQQPLQVGQYNRQQQQVPLQALSGMQSLYGTTPALASTFGNQALQGAQLQNQINQQRNQRGLGLVGQAMRL